MGRRPLGERALTPAEKQRRYRERKAAALGNSAPVTKPSEAAEEIAALAKELAQARARIAELEKRAKRPRRSQGGRRGSTSHEGG
jgi:hypothetical protein